MNPPRSAHPRPAERRRDQRALLAVAGALIAGMGLLVADGWPLLVLGLVLLALALTRR